MSLGASSAIKKHCTCKPGSNSSASLHRVNETRKNSATLQESVFYCRPKLSARRCNKLSSTRKCSRCSHDGKIKKNKNSNSCTVVLTVIIILIGKGEF